jgi:hypothetical protein
VIDARDLAGWIVTAAETGLAGTYNAVGPVTPRAELLETCRAVTGIESELVWVDPEFLVEQGVEQWMELPLWLYEPEYAAMLSAPVDRAVAAGLRTRPLGETARDTLEWVRSGEAPPDPPAGLAREKERQVLDAWLSKD